MRVALLLVLALGACDVTGLATDDLSVVVSGPACLGTRECGTTMCGPGEACVICGLGVTFAYDLGDTNSYRCVSSSFSCHDGVSCNGVCQGSNVCGPADAQCELYCAPP